MRRLAVTGGTGFVGRHFVRACLERYDVTLRLLTRRGHGSAFPVDRVVVCPGDLATGEGLDALVRDADTLVHLAYLRPVEKNLDAARHLASAVEASGIRRVVHCSTAVVVGANASAAVTEATPAAPGDAYQRAKYAVEQLLQETLTDIELAILRPTEIIGPGGDGLRTLIDRLRTKPWYVNAIYHSVLGSRRLNYVSVYNVVSAMLLLATARIERFGIYQVSDDDDDDNRYSAVERIISDALGRRSPRGPSLPRPVLATLLRIAGRGAADRIYLHDRLDRLGYRKHMTLRSAIEELVSMTAESAR